MSRTEEDKQLGLTREEAGHSKCSSRKVSTSASSTEKFRDIFYQQIGADEKEDESRRTKLLGE